MNLLIDCPHCHAEVSVAANVQIACPRCGQPVIAEDVPRVRAKHGQGADTPRWQIAFVLLVSLPTLGWWLTHQVDSHKRLRTNCSIVYQVGGSTRSASITLNRPDGGTEQHDVRVPWSQTYHADSGDFLYVAAQNKSGSGDVSVTIVIDGVAVQSAASSAEYGIAATQAVVP